MKSYVETIYTLNSLQKTAEKIEEIRRNRIHDFEQKKKTIIRCLALIGIQTKQLNCLNAVHIAGTKGKGSTSALVESLFRKSGMKTGLFTSPHLVSVRERIRINGLPLSEEEFAAHFWKIYDKVIENTDDDGQKPAYFTFLTLMAFYIFLKESVDVAVIEVGVGGEYDATNVIPSPVAVGITSLGIDHLPTLGDGIESIAWHKSGIFKRAVPAFTVPQRFQNAFEVLRRRAQEKECPLFVCPTLEAYKTENDIEFEIGIEGQIQRQNASLALQLHNVWMQQKKFKTFHSQHTCDVSNANAFFVDNRQLSGLRDCRLSGRCQTIPDGNIRYFLDGAHTVDSIRHCAQWFNEASKKYSLEYSNIKKVLLFNCTGLREQSLLLQELLVCEFDMALFTTNDVDSKQSKSSEFANFNVNRNTKLQMMEMNCKVWQKLAENNNRSVYVKKFNCVSDVIQWIQNEKEIERQSLFVDADRVHLLVTGSFHLIGAVLSIVDPKSKA